MDWKDELVATRADSEVFLKDTLRALIPEKKFVVDYADGKNDDLFITLVPSEKAGDKGYKETRLELTFFDDGRLQINDLYIDPAFRDKKLSLVLLKCACAIAAERGACCLEVEAVVVEGYAFWPRVMDSVPLSLPQDFGRQLNQAAKEKGITAEDAEVFIAAGRSAEKDALSGWRSIAQAPLSPAGRALCCRVFDDALDVDQDIYSFIGHPETRSRLTARLGALPAFRPLSTLANRRIKPPALFL